MNSALETLHIVAINYFRVFPHFSQGHEGAEPRALWACLCFSMALLPLLRCEQGILTSEMVSVASGAGRRCLILSFSGE